MATGQRRGAGGSGRFRATGWRPAVAAAAAGLALLASPASAQAPAAQAQAQAAATPPAAATRVALVVGEAAYRSGPRPAAADDAGLIAEVLAGAGFAVTAARDLDGDGLRRAIRDFLDRAGAAGPDGIAVVYLAGRAIQAEGETVFVPVDARLKRPTDVPLETLRLADLTHALAGLPIQARVVVVDGAYPGGPGGSAPGLALMEAEQGELVATNAAPGTVAPATAGDYGVYARALAAGMEQGGVPVGEVFARLRVAVNQASGGAVVPWASDRLTRSFAFFDRASTAPAIASAQVPFASLEKRPLRDFPADQAYDVALARDTLAAYAEFLAAFPDDPLARRVGPLLALRREATAWRAAVAAAAAPALWTYVARYPDGPHVPDARRRLTRLAAAAAPPAGFAPLGLDVPPPGRGELAALREAGRPAADLPVPPPPPLFLMPPPAALVLQRPAAPPARGLLPVPVAVSVPHVRPPLDPGTIAPPRGTPAAYPHPRPYARGRDGQGLVAEAGPGAEPAPQVPTAPRPGPVVPDPAVPPAEPPREPTPPAAPRVPSGPVAPVSPVAPTPPLQHRPPASEKPPAGPSPAPSRPADAPARPPAARPAPEAAPHGPDRATPAAHGPAAAPRPALHAAPQAAPHPAAVPPTRPEPRACGRPGEPPCRP